MFYKDNPITGADGEPVRKVLRYVNMPHGNIPIGQDSSVETNAKTICKFIQDFKGSEKIILYGTSKGGSDIKKSIELCGNEKYFSNVKAWLNVAGLLKGTELVTNYTDTLRKRLFLRFLTFLYGYSYQGLYDIRKSEDSTLSFELKIPNNFYVLNIIGVPLSTHISLRAFPNYLQLKPYGPNDGLTLLPDAIIPEGDILPLWGNDHYFIRFKKASSLLAILIWTMEEANKLK